MLALLFCLVFIMLFFGWIMQKITALQTPKATKEEDKDADVIAAIAMALHLASASKHDQPTSMITFDNRETAWNPKSEGFNNVGF